MITDDKIAELRELEAKATKGPWDFDVCEGECSVNRDECPRKGILKEDEQDDDCSKCKHFEFYKGAIIHQVKTVEYGDYTDMNDEDAAFICAARNALPSLLDEIERLRKSGDDLLRGIKDLFYQLDCRHKELTEKKIELDEANRKLAEKDVEIERLRKLAGIPVSDYCRRTYLQQCHICDRLDCCDNQSEWAEKWKEVNRKKERLQKENEWLKNEINLIIAPVEVGGGAKPYVLSVLADVRAAIGCANKPMLSELADTIRRKLSESRNAALEEAADKCETNLGKACTDLCSEWHEGYEEALLWCAGEIRKLKKDVGK